MDRDALSWFPSFHAAVFVHGWAKLLFRQEKKVGLRPATLFVLFQTMQTKSRMKWL